MNTNKILKEIEKYIVLNTKQKSNLIKCLKQINFSSITEFEIKSIIANYFKPSHFMMFPRNVLSDIFKDIDIDYVFEQCKHPIDEYLYYSICINPIFWKERLKLDFGYSQKDINKINKKTQHMNEKSESTYLIKIYKSNTLGDVWATGKNTDGQLGLGDNKDRITLEKIKNIPKIKYSACGVFHTILIDENGDVWATGKNTEGQLGLGDNKERDIPEKIENIPKIRYVSCGDHHTILIDKKGDVWATGYNKYGQLGLGDNKERDIPEKIKNIPKIKYSACGYGYTILIDEKGNVWVTGYNRFGQLWFSWERNTPEKIENIPKIRYVSCGDFHTILIAKN